MSGCGILTNGKGTKREYGDYNLDELSEGDRVGIMRKLDGDLHFFINGLDQGVAAKLVPSPIWGVIDLYGMTMRVTVIVYIFNICVPNIRQQRILSNIYFILVLVTTNVKRMLILIL